MKILIVCDNGVEEQHFRVGFSKLEKDHEIKIVELDRRMSFVPSTESEKRIARKPNEFAGSPKQLIKEIGDSDILVVNYAPVTAEIMDADKNLKLIGVTRSGPVNVDIGAALERGIPIVSSPDPIANQWQSSQ